MIEIVPATIEHAEQMVPRMRAADVREVMALGMSPFEAVRHSLAGSLVAEAGLVDGEVGAMWGACPMALAGDKALMWMLGTEHVRRHAKVLLRVSKHFVQHVQALYPILECHVDMRYHEAVRWVSWMGFEIEGEVPIGGAPFAIFRRRA